MHTVIIGAGASGLMAAITAAGLGAKVTVIEHENKICKKLAVTGNGKCNLTNLDMSSNKFHGDKSFVKNVKRCGKNKAIF